MANIDNVVHIFGLFKLCVPMRCSPRPKLNGAKLNIGMGALEIKVFFFK